MARRIGKSLFSNPQDLYRSTFRLFHYDWPNMQDSRPPGHSTRSKDHLKLMKYTMDINEEKVEATVHTDGLSYADFDTRTGKPKPWQLMKFIEGPRFFSHYWPLNENGRTFRDYAQMTDDRLTFLISMVVDLKPELYDTSLPKSPLDVKITGGFVGSTSQNSITTVLTSSGVELYSAVSQMVSVDKSTHRPLQLPEWWKEKYAKSAKPYRPLKVNKLERPGNIPFYDHKVARSGIDSNDHANWNVYIKFAFDAMYHFSKMGYLQSMPKFDDFNLKRMEFAFSGESFDDDILHVYVWEDMNMPTSVIVHIYKEDNHLFQGKFCFFDIKK